MNIGYSLLSDAARYRSALM